MPSLIEARGPIKCVSKNACVAILPQCFIKAQKQLDSVTDDIVWEAFLMQKVWQVMRTVPRYFAAGELFCDYTTLTFRLSEDATSIKHPFVRTRGIAMQNLHTVDSLDTLEAVDLRELGKLFADLVYGWRNVSFIHNDLHTANIMVVGGARGSYRLIDFGRSYVAWNPDDVATFARTTFGVRDYAPDFSSNKFVKIPSNGNSLCSIYTDMAGLLLYLVISEKITLNFFRVADDTLYVHTQRISQHDYPREVHVIELFLLILLRALFATVSLPACSSTQTYLALSCSVIMSADSHAPFYASGQLMPHYVNNRALHEEFMALYKNRLDPTAWLKLPQRRKSSIGGGGMQRSATERRSSGESIPPQYARSFKPYPTRRRTSRA